MTHARTRPRVPPPAHLRPHLPVPRDAGDVSRLVRFDARMEDGGLGRMREVGDVHLRLARARREQ
eukprot:1981887-Pleurochrysis_carterae.AAC.1